MNIQVERYIKRSSKMSKTKLSDIVLTDERTAIDIIQHFSPTGLVLDPCMGEGAFYNNFPGEKDWCEITKGRDFLIYEKHADWIISNPPWSNMVPFLIKGLSICDNLVYYIPTEGIWTKARVNLTQEMGFGLKELYFPHPDLYKWGKTISACYWQRGYEGPTNIGRFRYDTDI